MINYKKVLFVGSFLSKAKDGSVGGQMSACTSLINSPLSKSIEWILLDSTGKSVPPPPVYIRLFYAIKRVFKFVFLVFFHWPHSVLIFSANGSSVYEKGLLILIAKLTGRKSIYAPRGGALINELQTSRIKHFFFKVVAKNSDYIICQGSFWKEYFKGNLGVQFEKKLIVIPNWIDYELYQFPAKNLPKFDSYSLNILFMGWIQNEKGVHDLFDALMRIKRTRKKINVYFLGDGDQRKVLQKRVEKENKNIELHFFFPGWVHGADKSAFLQLADIFVLPSYAEGMPNSLMEAMAAGIASISTNVGAVPNLIEDQINGILYNPKDINALTDSLNKLLANKDLRENFASKAKDKIYREHSIDSAVSSFKRIL